MCYCHSVQMWLCVCIYLIEASGFLGFKLWLSYWKDIRMLTLYRRQRHTNHMPLHVCVCECMRACVSVSVLLQYLSTGQSHAPLSHSMRTRQVQLQSICPWVLNTHRFQFYTSSSHTVVTCWYTHNRHILCTFCEWLRFCYWCNFSHLCHLG